MVERKAKIVAVANEKGGVGKTVTVINVGAALARMGKKVLIVDVDPQAGATKGLGVVAGNGSPTTYEIMKDPKKTDSLKAVIPTKWDGLDIIAANADLAGAEVELVNVFGRENRLKRGLENVVGRYDYILLDTPPSLSLLTVNVFAFASEVIVPCQTHPFAYAALEELFDTVEAICDEINPDLSVCGVLATMFDGRTRVSHNILEKLRSHETYGALVFDTVIRINTTIAESAEAGKPVVFFRPSSSGSMDYLKLAEEFDAAG